MNDFMITTLMGLAVLVGIAWLFARMRKQSLTQVLFGREHLFGSDKKKENSGKGKNRKSGKTGKAGAAAPVKGQRNGSPRDIQIFASKLLTYARRHDMYMIYPGTVTDGTDTAVLLGIIATGKEFLGFNCFGYGGKIKAGRESRQWKQLIGDEVHLFDNPTEKTKRQYEIVRKAMDEVGLSEVPLRVFSVFTADQVVLDTEGIRYCYTVDELMKYLHSDEFGAAKVFDPKKYGQLLNERTVKPEKKTGKK